MESSNGKTTSDGFSPNSPNRQYPMQQSRNIGIAAHNRRLQDHH